MTRHLAAAGMLVALAGPALAQTSAPAAPEFRDEVIVTAERGAAQQAWIPAATTAVDASRLREMPAISLGDYLSFLPGFRVQQPALYSGRPVISARGFFGAGEAEYVALVVDGVRVNDAESGLVEWSTVPGLAISRIEAARGPGASLYGDAAIGGVIQVLTASGDAGGAFSLTGGSLGWVAGEATARWRRSGLSGFISGAGRRTTGITNHSGATEATVGGAVNGTVRGLSWRWTANALNRDQEDPGVLSLAQRQTGVSFDPLFRFDYRERQTLQTAVTLRSGGSGWTQQARLSVDRRAEDGIRTILLAPGLGDTRARDIDTGGVAASVDVDRTLGSLNSMIRFGADVERQHLNTNYRGVSNGAAAGPVLTTADGHRLRAGTFAAASWLPSSRVRVFGALRWDHIGDAGFGGSDPARAWSPRAGVVFRPAGDSGVSVFGQVSRAFKAPTIDQLFDPRPYPDFRGGTFTISNRRLHPQRAANLEAGVTGSRGLRWSLLAYRMSVEDEIDFDARTFSYGNIGRSRHTGIELEAEGPASARVRPVASYALSIVTPLEGDAGGQLKNVPRHQFSAGVFSTLAFGVDAFASVRRAWGAYLDDSNAMPIVSATLFDLRVRRAVSRASLFVDVLNAFGQRHDEFGFTLADFRGGTVGYIYAGAPRVVRAGVTVELP